MSRVKLLPEDTSPRVFFSTGTKLLDCVLGGGLILGRPINVVGDKSVGKTLFAIEASANFTRQFNEGIVYYKEREGAFDMDYARTVGLPTDRLDYDEEVDTVEKLCHFVQDEIDKDTKQARLIIQDSLDSLSDEKELVRKVGDPSMGMAKGKLLSEFFRKTAAPMRKQNITLLVISQIRDKTNAMAFGKQVERAGGHALDFYSAQVLWLYELGKITKEVGGIKRVTGINVKARCEKNKVGWPWRECEFPMTFGYGVDDVAAALQWLSVAAPTVMPTILEGMNKENWKRHVRKVDRAILNPILVKTWEDIDVQFRPETTKYGDLTPKGA